MREWLKEIRLKQGLSQRNVSEMLGISQQYYNLIELGARQRNMSVDMAEAISEALGVSLVQVLESEREWKNRAN